jgi:hypothetical protein
MRAFEEAPVDALAAGLSAGAHCGEILLELKALVACYEDVEMLGCPAQDVAFPSPAQPSCLTVVTSCPSR